MNSNQATINKMSEMRLHGIFRNLLETGKNMNLTTDEVVSYLIDSEWDEKHNRRLDRLTMAAKFRYHAALEDIDYTLDRTLDKNQILRLSDCGWIKTGQDVLVTGPTGVGKSYIGTALGYQACQLGYPVYYAAASRLFNELEEAKQDGTYLKVLGRLMKYKLFILDDFGLESLTMVARMALLEILEDRHSRKSTLIISQQPVSNWHELIGDPTIADAILDRIAFNSHRIDIDGDTARR
ncbi:MAG: IS21-like element helper ATPase IstB [Spirochaetales bacterium]|nr:IS21-like element helper ATPase IstB [Spirochaetales bacterium]